MTDPAGHRRQVRSVEENAWVADDEEEEEETASSARAAAPPALTSTATRGSTSTTDLLSPPAQSSVPSSPTPSATNTSNRRSTNDPRANRRFSGFISNLIHRRPEIPQSYPDERMTSRSPSLGTTQEATSPTRRPEESSSRPPSRASTPTPPRPVTPPPSLSAPTLSELGLSLSVLTANLAPSHFSTPPSSGAFLSPDHLLLCHAQGLDVLPLSSPPAPQPYALVRRVPFKSVVVMEERGVLVAIAGRRDGVRVYSLDEVKKAVVWRLEVEIRREQDRKRREDSKRGLSGSIDNIFTDKLESKSPITPRPQSTLTRKSSMPSKSPSSTRTMSLPRPHTAGGKAPQRPEIPLDPPPEYATTSLTHAPSIMSIRDAVRPRGSSVSNVDLMVPGTSASAIPTGDKDKGEWMEDNSDDEQAIDVVTAPSGSAALDERTSAQAAASANAAAASSRVAAAEAIRRSSETNPRRSMSMSRRRRPSNLDLSRDAAEPPSGTVMTPPSPAPTLMTLRHTLSHSQPTSQPLPRRESVVSVAHPGSIRDGDEDSGTATPTRERLTMFEMLAESRLPNLPPPGTRRPQQPLLLSSQHTVFTGDDPGSPINDSPRTSTSTGAHDSMPAPAQARQQRPLRNRRWSVLGGMFGSDLQSAPHRPPPPPNEQNSDDTSPPTPTRETVRPRATLQRSYSARSREQVSQRVPARPSTANADSTPAPVPPLPQVLPPRRFLPKIITQALNNRRSEERLMKSSESDRHSQQTPAPSLQPPPKLEYVKLPGTKNALMVKAVETPKKSFLAILCGDHGEKIELFAGTYRTALGLSRTFILPDSPRALELQLQGDDLVEVFLVFNHNVFGLEPATVRVREVRIGRAERRAARRRAREANNPGAPDEDSALDVGVTINASVQPSAENVFDTTSPEPPTLPATPSAAASQPDPELTNNNPGSTLVHEELAAVASSSAGPYTTFQQLSFAPKFPLASIADECIIPPSYGTFLKFKSEYEGSDIASDVDLSQQQFSPPGLPIPTHSPPSNWYYRDPKGVVHGPWKASLMQQWYKEGLLPPDLPVRRDEDSPFILLRDLRQQSVDTSHPFRPAPPPLNTPPLDFTSASKPLLDPQSLLTQPRHYGPPALFYSSRGGHSTAIVDARGKSVLKSRFIWSEDTEPAKLGDVTRVEAFDNNQGAVLVALRQGGIEATSLYDALLRPADTSRNIVPHYHGGMQGSFARREKFVWRIGMPTVPQAVSSSPISERVIPPTLSRKRHLKSPAKAEFALASDDPDLFLDEEVLFLGRKDDTVYFCERTPSSFRILRLCPHSNAV